MKSLGGDLKPGSREQSQKKAEGAIESIEMKMFVGNLSFDTSEQQLKELFSEHGEVTDVHMPTDRETGQPRGFAFVTMDSKSAMVNAIKALDGTEFDGRDIKVNEARAREERGGGGGGGGGYRGGGGGGGGGGHRGGGGGYGGGGGGGGGSRRY